MKKYDVILFDADGTLFDYSKAEENALKNTFARFGLLFSKQAHETYAAINAQAWARFEKGEVSKQDLQTMRFRELFIDLNLTCDAQAFNSRYIEELGKGAFLMDGAVDICKRLSRTKTLCIITNGIAAVQKSRLEKSQIREYISALFVSEEIGFAKPHPAYFNYVFSRLSLTDRSGALLVGDSVAADIAGGSNAGIDTCLVGRQSLCADASIRPTYQVNNLYDLCTLLFAHDF